MNLLKSLWRWLFPQIAQKEPPKPIPNKSFRPKKRKPLPKCIATDKVSMPENIAKARAAQISTPQSPRRAYKCEFCPHWHLTHKKNKMNMH